MYKIIALLFFCCLSFCQQTFPETPSVKVGVVGEPPFVAYQNAKPTGFIVNIWERIAEKNNISYQLVPMGTSVDSGLAAMSNGKVDMLIGNIGVTSERLKNYAFSRPIFINELALVTKAKPKNFFDIIKIVIAPFLQTVSIIFLCLLFIFSGIHCFSECRSKKTPLSIKAFVKSIWIIIIGILSVGYPEWPNTLLTRLLSIFTLLLGITFTVIFSAAVTTSMTISSSDLSLNNDFKADSFFAKNIAAIKGTYSTSILKSLNAHIIEVSNFNEGINLLRQNKVSGFLDNYATVKNSWDQSFDDLSYSKFFLGRNEIAFVFPSGNTLLRKTDIGLTSLQETNDIYQICGKYLDNTDAKNCII